MLIASDDARRMTCHRSPKNAIIISVTANRTSEQNRLINCAAGSQQLFNRLYFSTLELEFVEQVVS